MIEHVINAEQAITAPAMAANPAVDVINVVSSVVELPVVLLDGGGASVLIGVSDGLVVGLL